VDPIVVIFGLGVGLLIGLTGVGGGSLMTPLLILSMGVQPVVAIGTDIAYGAVTKTLGGWRHLRQATVDLALSRWLATGSVPGALAGVVLVDRLHEAHGEGFDDELLIALGISLLLVSVAVVGRALFVPRAADRETDTAHLNDRAKASAVGLGLVLGLILGMTSVGSGALFGFVLILVFRLTPRRVVGTDVFHAAVVLWAAGVAQLASGNVDLGLMANILVGSLPGVWVGAGLVSRVPQDGLRPVLGMVLLGSALAVFTKAGVAVPIGVVLGAPAAVGLVAWIIHGVRFRRRDSLRREAAG
jgi:uncharacterized membrane protein YfcA